MSISIDLGSLDGLSAPDIIRAAPAGWFRQNSEDFAYQEASDYFLLT